MKKLLFAAILLCGVFQLKAQQTKIKPVDSLALSINKEIQDQTDSWQKLTLKLNVTPLLTVNQSNTLTKVVIGASAVDNMPVAVLDGNSKMPVAKLDGLSKMPIARFESFDNSNAIKQKLAHSY